MEGRNDDVPGRGGEDHHTEHEGYTLLMRAITWRRYDVMEVLLAPGPKEDQSAADGKFMASLIANIPPDDLHKVPPAVRGLVDRHTPR